VSPRMDGSGAGVRGAAGAMTDQARIVPRGARAAPRVLYAVRARGITYG